MTRRSRQARGAASFVAGWYGRARPRALGFSVLYPRNAASRRAPNTNQVVGVRRIRSLARHFVTFSAIPTSTRAGQSLIAGHRRHALAVVIGLAFSWIVAHQKAWRGFVAAAS